jgi:nitrite reductase/ring-hydroxylating ferredoxin subunit
MGPVTARLIDELGYDPDDPDGRLETNYSYLPNRWLASGGWHAPGGPNGPNGPAAAARAVPALADLDPAIDVPTGAILRARDGARAVAVARLGSGRLVVVDDVCPHDGGRISDGFVEGERLVCARHGWELEVDGGRCRRARNCKLRE